MQSSQDWNEMISEQMRCQLSMLKRWPQVQLVISTSAKHRLASYADALWACHEWGIRDKPKERLRRRLNIAANERW